ncbi:MAG: tRNA uridine-5-carboxymethylaminomethyl(34) synthesis enzyme MnmG [Clostridia bacterium]|nr:tRNA uridine-5-carboxymethylaminomethyl(34) synthesis enzyme MnmG [Clostridia bacterium]
MKEFSLGSYDAAVVGAGHAGCEAALALARTGLKTAVLTLNLDSIAFMACNPSIGGTAKGHLVREIDALGGEMGVNADATALQIKMLNVGKGAAVQSLRCQSDKNAYHARMKSVLENTQNLRIIQGEVAEIIVEDGKVAGLKTTYGGVINCRAVVLATGVYLNAQTITGDVINKSGPNGFSAADALTQNLIDLGFTVRRFKTGTPARVDFRTIDLSKLTPQYGESNVGPFSFITKNPPENKMPCYLGYTNLATHKVILDNLDRSPLYNGTIESTGPRYCPSIETKVVRFADKDRHQIFIEPEGADTLEAYVQGMSSSLPHDIQIEMYRTVEGLENADIMRFAYAIEYDCIDTLDVYPTLEFKKVQGLYTAGQINGTSGYEEAAAQGLIAGLNASLKLRGMPPLVLGRDEAYIGVLIDDLVTKGTEEPYRMMTSRAEYRIELRQDNADFRLTQKGYDCGLVTEERYKIYLERKEQYEAAVRYLEHTSFTPDKTEKLLQEYGFARAAGSLSLADLIRRGIPLDKITAVTGEINFARDVLDSAEIFIRYEGYLKKNAEQIARAKKYEDKLLSEDIDYSKIEGLRLEAREKLNKVKPRSLGQASRISGVNPADIAVLTVWLSLKK